MLPSCCPGWGAVLSGGLGERVSTAYQETLPNWEGLWGQAGGLPGGDSKSHS